MKSLFLLVQKSFLIQLLSTFFFLLLFIPVYRRINIVGKLGCFAISSAKSFS